MALPRGMQCGLVADVGDVGACQHKPQAGMGSAAGSALSAFRKRRERRETQLVMKNNKKDKTEEEAEA